MTIQVTATNRAPFALSETLLRTILLQARDADSVDLILMAVAFKPVTITQKGVEITLTKVA